MIVSDYGHYVDYKCKANF